MRKQGRPSTRPAVLKDGFYIELRNKGSKGGGVKIRRNSKEEMLNAVKEYAPIKDLIIFGESKKGKWVNPISNN